MARPDGGGGGQEPKAGNLVLTPQTSTSLGFVVVAASASVTFTAQNTGAGFLSVTSITAAGAEWALSGLPVLPKGLGPGASVTFTLTLTPTSTGAKATTLIVSWIDAYGTEPSVQVAVTATGINSGANVCAFTPASLAFGATQVNKIATLVDVLKNVGSNATTIKALTFGSWISSPQFSGTGLNDAISGGAFTQPDNLTHTYTAIIDAINGVGIAVVDVPSTGYAVNDTGTINTGSGTAAYKVTAVVAGAPTTIVITTIGNGYSLGNNVATTTTTGVGVGLTVTITQLQDSFKWQKDSGAFTNGVLITGSSTLQTLTDGIQIGFAAAVGHTAADTWIITAPFTANSVFSLVAPPLLPKSLLTVFPFNQVSLTIQFAPTTVGVISDTLYAITDLAGTVALPLQGLCLLILPVDVVSGSTRQVMIGGYDASGLQGTPAPLLVSPNNYNSEQAGSIVFNGALWEGLGEEKTILRLGFYYENLGVATLTGNLVVFRPQIAPDNVQTVPFSITLGTAAADGSIRYEETDAIATGEIITLSIARAGSSGPVSLCAIVPYFEPRGEKVRAS